jgi:hypothetical protein
LSSYGIGAILRQRIVGLTASGAVGEAEEYNVLAGIVEVGQERDDAVEVNERLVIQLRASGPETKIQR